MSQTHLQALPGSMDEVLRAYYEAFSAQDEEWIISLCTPGHIRYSPPFKEPLVGPEGIRGLIRITAGYTRSIDLQLLGATVAGRFVCCRWRSRLVNKDGDELEIEGLEVLRMSEGLFDASWSFFDLPAWTG